MRGDETIFVDFSEPSTCAIQLKWADRTVHLPLIQFYDGRYWQKLNVSNDHFPTGRELHLKIKVKNNVSNLNLEKKQNPCLTNFDNCRIELHSLPHGCEQPAAPLNGHVTWVEGEATATFTCERGFTLTSNSSLQCICGRWNGSVPTCKRNLFWFNLIFNSILPRRSSQIASNSHQSNNRRRHAQLHQIFTSFIF